MKGFLKKIDYSDFLIGILAVIACALPFVKHFSTDSKIPLVIVGISLFSQLIKRKVLKYILSSVCLTVLLIYWIWF